MLKRMFPERRYVTLDDPFAEQQARESGGMFLMLNPCPVTIDEVQRAPELFRFIKMGCDQSEGKGLFCLSGSQQFVLMKNVSESLSGRVRIMELSGLSMREILGDPFNQRFLPTMEYVLERQKTVKPPANIWEIIHRGSYPALQEADTEWAAFYGDYIRTYIERDVRELSAVQDPEAFRRFMIAAAARTGEVLNYSHLADEIGKDVSTVKNWISILEASGVIYLLEPYTANVLKRAIRTPKLYFRDTGLACYLTRWLTAETLACGAFGAHGETAEVESEIDLIIEENGILYPIEIKKNSHVTPDVTGSFFVLDKIEGKKRGMGAVICMGTQPGLLRENILQIPVCYI